MPHTGMWLNTVMVNLLRKSHFQFLITVELETSNEVLLNQLNKLSAMMGDPLAQKTPAQSSQWTRVVALVSLRDLLGTSTLFLGPMT
jgi:hypothetical protein